MSTLACSLRTEGEKAIQFSSDIQQILSIKKENYHENNTNKMTTQKKKNFLKWLVYFFAPSLEPTS